MILRATYLFLCCIFLSGSALAAKSGESLGKATQVFIGTYTGERSKGIYVTELMLDTGEMSPPRLAAEIASPSFLVIHPNRNFLYAVNEVSNFRGSKDGAVSAYEIEGNGQLKMLNQQSAKGGGPCHLITDRKGTHVLIANYGGGSVAAFPVQNDGSLGNASAFVQHRGSSVNKQRQEAPHAHGIYLDAKDRFAFVPDLGLDQVLIYRFDKKNGSLTPHSPAFGQVAGGAGPRHLAISKNGKNVFVLNELTSTITQFDLSKKGVMKERTTVSTLPEPVKGNSTAEIQLHPSGKFLYASNRGHNSIAVFAVDARSGDLKLQQHQSTQGKIPRNFSIDPSGKYLLAANQESDSVVSFRIDAKTGRLTSTGHSITVGKPVCVSYRE